MPYNQEPEHRIRRGRFSLASSGFVTTLVLAVGLAVIGGLWWAHLRGRLHKLSTTAVPPETTVVPRPGGQDLIDVHRMTPGGGVTAQLTGLTLMPGVGMGILQLTMDQPGRDTSNLLQGTPIEKLTAELTPRTSQPKPSLVFTPFSLRLMPLLGAGDGVEVLGTRPANQVHTDSVPGGTGATAIFSPNPLATPEDTAPAPLPLDTSVSSSISDRGLEVSVTTHNVSTQPQRIVLSWNPHFLLPSAGPDKLSLTGPDTSDSHMGLRSTASEVQLTNAAYHHTWTNVKHTYLSAGPELQLRNAADGYTLRLTALTPSVRSVKVAMEPPSGTIAFNFSTAADLNAQTDRETVIEPGDTLQWRVRVQVTASQTYRPPVN